MDFKTRRKYYNLCNPDESLSPDDARNVDIDAMEGKARGISWAGQLAQTIELSDEPVLLMFTGLPGSGKSTELRRLAAQLADPERLALLPVIVDAEELISLSAPIDVPDILAAILYAAEREVLRLEGGDVQQAMVEGYAARFWNWLTKTDVTINDASYDAGSSVSLVMQMKTQPTLRQRVRQVVSEHLSAFLKQVEEEMVELEARTRAAGRGGLVIIFDTLEKLRGVTSNWYEVLESAEQLFGQGAPYLRLPVHTVYTVPPTLLTRVPQIEFMPMIKLRHREGRISAAGLEAARALVRQRIPDAIMAALLGEGSEARLQEMILWSGGYPRELIRLLRELLTLEAFPVQERDLTNIRTRLFEQTQRLIQRDDAEWLAQVAHTKYFAPLNDQHRLPAARMLNNNVLLGYRNADIWYDLHPAAYRVPFIKEAIARLRDGT